MPVRFLVPAAVVLILVSALASVTAFARIMQNTIDPVASMADTGRRLVLTGPIQCEAGQKADLRVTVTQRSTGAVAEGYSLVVCTGGVQQWEISATTRGRKTFDPGPAVATALAGTSAHGDTDDAPQWLVEITLVRE